MLPPASMALGFVVGAGLARAGLRRLEVALVLLSAVETLVLSVTAVAKELVAPLEQYARDEALPAAVCCYSVIGRVE